MTQNNSNNLAAFGVDVQVTWTSALYIALAGIVIILCFFLSKRFI